MSAAPLPRPERRKGFTALPNECLWDWHRLASGDAQLLSIILISSETISAAREKGTPAPKWSRVISNEELAAFCGCSTTRAVEIAMADLSERRVIERKKVPGKGYCYHVPFETWPELPDRPSKIVSMPTPQEVEEEPETEEPAAPAGIVHEFPAKRLRAGKRSRPTQLPVPAEKLQYQPDLDGVVVKETMIDGVVIASIFVKECVEKEKEKQTRGEENRNVPTKPFRQATHSKRPPSFSVSLSDLHAYLDDYCLKNHGTTPPDKLLLKVQSALASATMEQYKRILIAKAKARNGPIPMGLLVNLAEDAARGAKRSA
jgi:hypothetical protein